ncbi:protein FAR1-RELATED SEQUENCE 9 isoform X2 [Cynara cardunculus var. scolymus]|nr:protein FAR1-RELATED SEQUENCE 9 isoform X2 [Cynara cardunculus var. scolymus]XP_024958684.1 protein FAR1-RELATED SEQUENCE 9 isoform X2 [Cynara cardunculus var. scolymus]
MSIDSRHRTLGSGVLDYLKRMQAENPSFFYAIQCDGEQSNGNVFWADSTFRMNYNYFGDTVRLDTSYRANHYRVPLVSITGLNHHGQPILFGCGLLHYESESAYVWLLQNWLHAMSGNYPVSITTEPDHHIQMAVAEVLPQTRHRFCKWSIFRETQEKLAQTHPTFDKELGKCIHETGTVDEFESCWQALVERYSLIDDEWVQSIYNARHQWVPVYLQETFFGELYTTIPLNMFFDGYVNATTSIQSLVKQYEDAVTSWHEMELKADFETTNTMPLLKTPSPMEKQVANLYTRRAFIKFQEELVETLANPATKLEDNGTVATYRVAKFGEEQKAHVVRFNPFEMKANCSCHMFEFSGIICRHALSVFRAKNVLTLPSQYILKRWTRDAKREEYVPELPSNSQDSLTVRYSNLRQEAIKFVEEGAKSIHIYNAALDALQVAAKKVAASKKQRSRGVVLNGGIRETDLDKGSQLTPYQSRAEKEKKIRELSAELDNTNERCEVYRANLLAVLRDMEEQKLKLSVKVQNARLSLKE